MGGGLLVTGIENLTRFLSHGRVGIADDGNLKVVISQMLRLHRNDTGEVVNVDDLDPDALICAMLHYRFEDEFDSLIADLYTGSNRERSRVTNKLLDSCVRDYPLIVRSGPCGGPFLRTEHQGPRIRAGRGLGPVPTHSGAHSRR